MTPAAARPVAAAARHPARAPAARYRGLDALRGLAASCVLVSHLFALYGLEHLGYAGVLPAHLGTAGVMVFFSISGFVLYRPFVAAAAGLTPAPRLRDYAARRLWRIVPAYWLALSVSGLLLNVPGTFGRHWYAVYGFGQVYSRSTAGLGLPVAWSLCVEMTFYVALPFAAILLGRLAGGPRAFGRHVATLLACGAASAVLYAWLLSTPSHDYLTATLPATFGWFTPGMVLAVASVASACGTPLHGPVGRAARRLAARPGRCVAAAACALAAWCLVFHADRHPVERVHGPLGEVLVVELLGLGMSALLLLPAVAAPRPGRPPLALLRWPPLLWLGTISYGVYLWHFSLMAYVRPSVLVERSPLPLLTLGVLGAGASVALASASWYLLEAPLLRRRRARAAPSPAPAPAAAPSAPVVAA